MIGRRRYDPSVGTCGAGGIGTSSCREEKIIAQIIEISGEIVAAIDDLLKQILLRLPIKSLLRFKLVSMHWNYLISNPRFRHLRNPDPNLEEFNSNLFSQYLEANLEEAAYTTSTPYQTSNTDNSSKSPDVGMFLSRPNTRWDHWYEFVPFFANKSGDLPFEKQLKFMKDTNLPKNPTDNQQSAKKPQYAIRAELRLIPDTTVRQTLHAQIAQHETEE
ncbi:hypothetical protein DH2020_044502 [Rehmannia glutinosa]|uniref:F-box domain-containing protein n=1 Tax=Rehmannia glutinosa TaxID=99300 RepID=A0ABR0UHI2_REHGL